jgi:YspA, cpYpsA-related SLOG family
LRVLICGGRDFWDSRVIYEKLKALKNVTLVIDGGADGADLRGHIAAVRLGIPTKRFPANWEMYGKAAGAIRNQEMLDVGKPDLVLAFPTAKSVGTWDMIQRARKKGVEVRVSVC